MSFFDLDSNQAPITGEEWKPTPFPLPTVLQNETLEPQHARDTFISLHGLINETLVFNFSMHDPNKPRPDINQLSEDQKKSLVAYVPCDLYLSPADTRKLKAKGSSSFAHAKALLQKQGISDLILSDQLVTTFLATIKKFKAEVAKLAREKMKVRLLFEMNEEASKAGTVSFHSFKYLKAVAENNEKVAETARNLLENKVYPEFDSAKYKRSHLAEDLAASARLVFIGSAKDCIRKHITQLASELKTNFKEKDEEEKETTVSEPLPHVATSTTAAAGPVVFANTPPSMPQAGLESTVPVTTEPSSDPIVLTAQIAALKAQLAASQNSNVPPPQSLITTNATISEPQKANATESTVNSNHLRMESPANVTTNNATESPVNSTPMQMEAPANVTTNISTESPVNATPMPVEAQVEAPANATPNNATESPVDATPMPVEARVEAQVNVTTNNATEFPVNSNHMLVEAQENAARLQCFLQKTKETEKATAQSSGSVAQSLKQNQLIAATVAVAATQNGKSNQQKNPKKQKKQKKQKPTKDTTKGKQTKGKPKRNQTKGKKTTGKRNAQQQNGTTEDTTDCVCIRHKKKSTDLQLYIAHEIKEYMKEGKKYNFPAIINTSNCLECSNTVTDLLDGGMDAHLCHNCYHDMDSTIKMGLDLGDRKLVWVCQSCHNKKIAVSGRSTRNRKKSRKHDEDSDEE